MSGKPYSSGIAAYSQRPVEKPYLAVAANVNDSFYTTVAPGRKYNSSTHTNPSSASIITSTAIPSTNSAAGAAATATPSTHTSSASANAAAGTKKKTSMSNTNSTMTVNTIDAAAAVENKADASQGRRSGSKRTHEQAATSDQQPQKGGVSEVPRKRQKVTYVLPHQNMEEGHFYVVLGEDIDVSTQRFKILSLLGEGTFGKVVEAWDRKRKEYCAVKIVRNVPKYTRDAKIEIQFMEKVRQADPNDRVPVMKIQRYFQNDTAHMCIVMPKYGPCLLDWIMKHGPFAHRHLAQIVFHCGVALDFFHSDLHLMHTDLKPENILMETVDTVTDPSTNRVAPPDPCRVRLCDLGGCCDERHSRTAIVSTRHYRSPEVILGLGWMYSTDMWSIGCILYELYTGKLLYDTHDNLEHLHLMERTLGRLPSEWAGRCGTEEVRGLFNSAGQLRSCTDPKHLARIARARAIQDTVRDDLLLDLILGLLSYDRQRRLNARQMTTHPYVLKYYPEARKSPSYPDNRATLRPPPIM